MKMKKLFCAVISAVAVLGMFGCGAPTGEFTQIDRYNVIYEDGEDVPSKSAVLSSKVELNEFLAGTDGWWFYPVADGGCLPLPSFETSDIGDFYPEEWFRENRLYAVWENTSSCEYSPLLGVDCDGDRITEYRKEVKKHGAHTGDILVVLTFVVLPCPENRS